MRLGDLADGVLVLLGRLGRGDDVGGLRVLLETDGLGDLTELVGGGLLDVVDLGEDPVLAVGVAVSADLADAELALERGEDVVDLGRRVGRDRQLGDGVERDLASLHRLDQAAVLRLDDVALRGPTVDGRGLLAGVDGGDDVLGPVPEVLEERGGELAVLDALAENRDAGDGAVESVVLGLRVDLGATCAHEVAKRARAVGVGHGGAPSVCDLWMEWSWSSGNWPAFRCIRPLPPLYIHTEESGRYIKKPHRGRTIVMLMGC